MSCRRVEVAICAVRLEVQRIGVARRHGPAPNLGFISLNQIVLYTSYVQHLFGEIERE